MIPAVLISMLVFQSPFTAAPDHYKLEFENEWVQVVRVSYGPHGMSPMHDHPEQPTVMIYTTDGAPLKFKHKDGMVVDRPAVKANGIRFTRGAAESHIVEYLGDQPSEYLRVELKTEPIDRPERDVRIAPMDRKPFENGQIRIMRVTCPAKSACPASDHAGDPAVVVTGSRVEWLAAGSPGAPNSGDTPLDQIRIELKARPIGSHRSQ